MMLTNGEKTAICVIAALMMTVSFAIVLNDANENSAAADKPTSPSEFYSLLNDSTTTSIDLSDLENKNIVCDTNVILGCDKNITGSVDAQYLIALGTHNMNLNGHKLTLGDYIYVYSACKLENITGNGSVTLDGGGISAASSLSTVASMSIFGPSDTAGIAEVPIDAQLTLVMSNGTMSEWDIGAGKVTILANASEITLGSDFTYTCGETDNTVKFPTKIFVGTNSSGTAVTGTTLDIVAHRLTVGYGMAITVNPSNSIVSGPGTGSVVITNTEQLTEAGAFFYGEQITSADSKNCLFSFTGSLLCSFASDGHFQVSFKNKLNLLKDTSLDGLMTSIIGSENSDMYLNGHSIAVKAGAGITTTLSTNNIYLDGGTINVFPNTKFFCAGSMFGGGKVAVNGFIDNDDKVMVNLQNGLGTDKMLTISNGVDCTITLVQQDKDTGKPAMELTFINGALSNVAVNGNIILNTSVTIPALDIAGTIKGDSSTLTVSGAVNVISESYFNLDLIAASISGNSMTFEKNVTVSGLLNAGENTVCNIYGVSTIGELVSNGKVNVCTENQTALNMTVTTFDNCNCAIYMRNVQAYIKTIDAGKSMIVLVNSILTTENLRDIYKIMMDDKKSKLIDEGMSLMGEGSACQSDSSVTMSASNSKLAVILAGDATASNNSTIPVNMSVTALGTYNIDNLTIGGSLTSCDNLVISENSTLSLFGSVVVSPSSNTGGITGGLVDLAGNAASLTSTSEATFNNTAIAQGSSCIRMTNVVGTISATHGSEIISGDLKSGLVVITGTITIAKTVALSGPTTIDATANGAKLNFTSGTVYIGTGATMKVASLDDMVGVSGVNKVLIADNGTFVHGNITVVGNGVTKSIFVPTPTNVSDDTVTIAVLAVLSVIAIVSAAFVTRHH